MLILGSLKYFHGLRKLLWWLMNLAKSFSLQVFASRHVNVKVQTKWNGQTRKKHVMIHFKVLPKEYFFRGFNGTFILLSKFYYYVCIGPVCLFYIEMLLQGYPYKRNALLILHHVKCISNYSPYLLTHYGKVITFSEIY